MNSETISALELAWNVRGGGGGRTERRFLDYVVDGTPLSSVIKADVISPFGWCVAAEQVKAASRLVREASPDLPEERVSLFVCPECGDLDCGAVGITVDRGQGLVIWRDFAFESNGERSSYALGPFRFDGRAYHQQFERLRRECAAGLKWPNHQFSSCS